MIDENINSGKNDETNGGSVITGLVVGILAAAFIGPLLFISVNNPDMGSTEIKGSASGILTLVVGVMGMASCRIALLRQQKLKLEFKVLFGLSVVIASIGLAMVGVYVAQTLPTLANFN
jgi:hypothetical membrane protein